MAISNDVIPAGEQMLHPERALAGIQFERPAPWEKLESLVYRLLAADNNLGPGKRRFLPRLGVVTPG